MNVIIFFTCTFLLPYATSKSTYQVLIPKSADGFPHARLYGSIDQPLDEYTLCHWTRQFEDKNWGTVFSYDVLPSLDAISTIQGANGLFIIYQNGDKAFSFESGIDTLPWLHTCITASTTRGTMSIFFNGKKINTTKVGKLGLQVPPNGTIILGQDPKLSGFDANYKFSGYISEVLLWDYLLSPKEINKVFQCNFAEDANIVSWDEDSWTVHDDARISLVYLPCGDDEYN